GITDVEPRTPPTTCRPPNRARPGWASEPERGRSELRLEDASEEDQRARLLVDDRDEEGAIDVHDRGRVDGCRRALAYDDGRGRGRLGAFLVDLDERLVEDVFDLEGRLRGDPREIGLPE